MTLEAVHPSPDHSASRWAPPLVAEATEPYQASLLPLLISGGEQRLRLWLDREPLDLRPGELALVNARQPFRIRRADLDRVAFVELCPELIERALPADLSWRLGETQYTERSVSLWAPEQHALGRLRDMRKSHWLERDAMWASPFVRGLVARVARQSSTAGRPHGLSAWSTRHRDLARVLQLLRGVRVPEMGLSLEGLAEIANMSRWHFVRAFGAEFGVTPTAYLTTLRLAAAERLMRTTELTAAQVATRCGYAGGSAFSRAFSRVYGLPPTRYRRRHRDPESSLDR